jgi:hypothetical protein
MEKIYVSMDTLDPDTIDVSGADNGPFDDNDRFVQLFVPDSEMVGQGDGVSCGIFICLFVLQFICLQSGCPYLLKDMDKATDNNAEGSPKYFVPASYNFMKLLQSVDWASMDDDQKKAHSLQMTTRFRREFRVFLDCYSTDYYKSPSEKQQAIDSFPVLARELLHKLQCITQEVMENKTKHAELITASEAAVIQEREFEEAQREQEQKKVQEALEEAERERELIRVQEAEQMDKMKKRMVELEEREKERQRLEEEARQKLVNLQIVSPSSNDADNASDPPSKKKREFDYSSDSSIDSSRTETEVDEEEDDVDGDDEDNSGEQDQDQEETTLQLQLKQDEENVRGEAADPDQDDNDEAGPEKEEPSWEFKAEKYNRVNWLAAKTDHAFLASYKSNIGSPFYFIRDNGGCYF